MSTPPQDRALAARLFGRAPVEEPAAEEPDRTVGNIAKTEGANPEARPAPDPLAETRRRLFDTTEN